MKNTLILFLLLSMSACIPHIGRYYQIYTTVSDDVPFENEQFVYQNDDIAVYYYFWEDYGNSGFTILNKTQKSLYLNVEECQFIINGFAFDYYQKRTYGESSSSSISRGNVTTSLNTFTQREHDREKSTKNEKQYITTTSNNQIDYTQNSVNFREKKVVVIPPGAKKSFFEYKIAPSLYTDFGLVNHPYPDEIDTLKFSHRDSPIIFSNFITYSLEREFKEKKCLRHEFWVSEIFNLPWGLAVEEVVLKNPGTKSFIQYVPRYQSGNRFYIEY